jgi:hypothetical protein
MKSRSAARTTARRRGDLVAATAAISLFATAALVGGLLYLLDRPVYASAAPLFAHWLPHAGPGTPVALSIAVLVCAYGPALAARLPWRRLSFTAYGTSVVWIFDLALVDGWHRGITGRLTTTPEYLHEVAGVTSIPAMLRGFTSRILDFQPDSWTTHVSGHPPGALLVFVWLDRAGLSGGGWAGVLCILTGALTAVAVPWTVRLLGSDQAARASVPFAVLFPGAVWIGVSADGLFAGVTASGVALLASGLIRGAHTRTLAGGVLLGFACYLSYGLLLMAPIVLAVLVFARAHPRFVASALLGAAAVVAGFTAAGFDWLTGYQLVSERYYQGVAAHRPYAYWVWADLAILTVSTGPACAVILARAAGRVRRPLRIEAAWVLPLAAAVAILAADLSGYSKAEVERIWLPFAVWFMAGAGLIPPEDRRRWLAVQAVVAVTVNHLLLTTW